MGKKTTFALHGAANEGNVKELKKILNRKPKLEIINALDGKHWSSLHCAANARSLECCRLLLEHKADPHNLTSTNNTALHFLVTMPYQAELENILQLLVRNNADVNYPTTAGFTPLHEASLRGNSSTVKFLITQNALVNFRGSSGVTPLHCAIQGMAFDTIKLLLEAGARVDIHGYKEGTALQLAKQVFNEEQYKNFIGQIRKYQPEAPDELFVVAPYNYDTLSDEVKALANEAGIDKTSINRNFTIFCQSFNLIFPELIQCPPRIQATFDTTIDPRAMYDIEEASGSGGFGRVFVARCKRTKNLVAIKILPHNTKKEMTLNQIELDTLQRSQCRNVVTLLGAYFIEEKKEVWIVTEYLSGGMLWDMVGLIKRKKKQMTEPQVAYVAKQILEALLHMHTNHIVHRDLKTNNIIFTHHGDLKLIDFGLALDLRGDSRSRFQLVGSPAWISPEIIIRQPQTPAVDIWGLGLVILELCNGETSSNTKLGALFRAGIGEKRELNQPEKWSEEMRHFVGKCLRQDPATRGTSELMLQHEWIQKAGPREDITKLIVTHTVMLNENIQALGF